MWTYEQPSLQLPIESPGPGWELPPPEPETEEKSPMIIIPMWPEEDAANAPP